MNAIKLTQGQEEALKMARALAARARGFGILTGYAGTGKTTMLRIIAEVTGEPMVLAPTGKAAVRVTEATGLPARTIHRWIYKPLEDAFTGKVNFSVKNVDEIDTPPGKLVVIDEASMLAEENLDDVLRVCRAKGLALLLVGDLFQLPPVTRSDSQSPLAMETEHKANLTEVLRQAQENPIIRASMRVRESTMGTMQALMEMPSIPQSQLVEKATELTKSGGATIVHKNRSRHLLNRAVRRMLSLPDTELAPGEPLLVLFNNYALEKFNGEVAVFDRWLENWFGEDVFNPYSDPPSKMSMTFGLAEVEGKRCLLSPEEVRGDAEQMPVRRVFGAGARIAERRFLELPQEERPRGHLNANFGYCLTAHKAQGSEWNEVLVLAESSVKWSSYEGRRWIYTALTRARKTVHVCMEPDVAKACAL